MKEHALPQDVTGYKFHIIGNMTLKQFAEVGAGCGLGFIIYLTNLPDIIKWPSILISSGIGALAAFVPFEERPLDHWIVVLVAALYRPTQFYWKRMSHIPEPFLYVPKTETQSMVKEVDLTPARRQRVKDYLHSVVPTVEPDSIETYSNQRLSEIMSVFDEPVSAHQSQTQTQTTPPPMDTRSEAVLATTPIIQDRPQVTFKTKTMIDQTKSYVPETVAQNLASSANIKTQVRVGNDMIAPAQKSAMSAMPVGQSVAVPQNQGVVLTRTTTQTDGFVPRTSPQDPNQIGDTYIAGQNQAQTSVRQASQPAIETRTLPFPAMPTVPNKVVGMALDQHQNPLTNVIIEILTADGVPARAVKTNILGQFFITTPLGNGKYTISAEKTGYTFPTQSLELTGQVVGPIEVRSQE